MSRDFILQSLCLEDKHTLDHGIGFALRVGRANAAQVLELSIHARSLTLRLVFPNSQLHTQHGAAKIRIAFVKISHGCSVNRALCVPHTLPSIMRLALHTLRLKKCTLAVRIWESRRERAQNKWQSGKQIITNCNCNCIELNIEGKERKSAAERAMDRNWSCSQTHILLSSFHVVRTHYATFLRKMCFPPETLCFNTFQAYFSCAVQ